MGERTLPLTDDRRQCVQNMNRRQFPNLAQPTASRRGPKPRSWYEAGVRHALRNYRNPRVLSRNPLLDAPAIVALADHDFADSWNPHVAALRCVLVHSVNDVLKSADEPDRQPLDIVLHGVMRGRTIRAVAADLSCGREWLHKTWWPEAVRAVTTVMLQRHLRAPSLDLAGEVSGRSAVRLSA